MTKVTTKDRIKGYLNTRGWVSGTELEDMSHVWETKSSIIRRRAQELAHDGYIERQLSDRRTVQYKTKAPVPRPVLPEDQARLFDIPATQRRITF